MRARAEELAQKKKAAENSALKKRKTAGEKARERQELEEKQAAKRAKELARKEKQEVRPGGASALREVAVLTRPNKETFGDTGLEGWVVFRCLTSLSRPLPNFIIRFRVSVCVRVCPCVSSVCLTVT